MMTLLSSITRKNKNKNFKIIILKTMINNWSFYKNRNVVICTIHYSTKNSSFGINRFFFFKNK